METRYSLAIADQMLPLIEVIAGEITDRRDARRALCQDLEDLETAETPEGLGACTAEINAQIYEHDEGLRIAQRELEGMGLRILRLTPLTLHIPGKTRQGPIVFCWQEGEVHVCHGHPIGEEEDPRRPLKVRSTDVL